MLKIVTGMKEAIRSAIFGGKAYGLWLLHLHGMRIPSTIFVEATRDPDQVRQDAFRKVLGEAIVQKMAVNGGAENCIAENPANAGVCFDVAIRSSGTAEDAFEESMAGHFITRIGRMNLNEIIESMALVVRLGTAQGDAAMGVVIQEKIEADYSGVIFSSDPVTYQKKKMLISYTTGLGENLVSGELEGKDAVVFIEDGEYSLLGGAPESDASRQNISRQRKGLDESILLILSRQVKRLEEKFGYPLDVEWAVRNKEIFFLQCRPLASITKAPTVLRKVDAESLLDLPDTLVRHDKVALRLFARQAGIKISDAYLFIKNNAGNVQATDFRIQKSKDCRGYSAVIIYPRRLSNKVIRSFVGDSSDMDISADIMNCCRYGVRSFPEYGNIEKCMNEYAERVSEEYWISATIIQEVYDPLYTGIIKQVAGGFIIEITRGHFLTKGVVPSSQYVITSEGALVAKEETVQNYWYKIIEGHVFYCVCNEGDEKQVTLTEQQLLRIRETLAPVIRNESIVVEFGILMDRDKNIFQPYLIDFVDDGSDCAIEKGHIEEGIFSRGVVSGEIVYIQETRYESLDAPDAADQEVLGTHLYDDVDIDWVEVKSDGGTPSEEGIIYFCKRPVISLLSIINSCDPGKTGFVFAEGSILCHVAVVLREKGIPAVKTGVAFDGREGICMIDASTAGLAGQDRVRFS